MLKVLCVLPGPSSLSLMQKGPVFSGALIRAHVPLDRTIPNNTQTYTIGKLLRQLIYSG